MRTIIVLAAFAAWSPGCSDGAPAQPAPRPATPLRFTDVATVFATHCASCHDARRGENAGAQEVFEMSAGYPFATDRPDTLLKDLREMFESRGGLSAEEKHRGVAWVDGGGLDADGRPPVWRKR